MSDQHLEVSRQGDIAICKFNPPGGFMTAQTVIEMDELTEALEKDDSLRVIIFTGAQPGVFIQHYSVVELEAMVENLRKRQFKFDPARNIPERDIDRVFNRLEGMSKPVIAAINGNAMGGGFETALACDIRLAEDGPYSLGLPEVRVGILPGAGGTQRLTRVVGMARALEMIMRGRTVAPAEAAALGMVHEVCSSPVLERALVIAGELAAKSPRAVGHIKRLVRSAAHLPLQEGLALERSLYVDLLTTPEAYELLGEMNRSGRDIRQQS